MSDELATTRFGQLPRWVQAKVQELEVSEPEKWVMRPIPALRNRSIVEINALPNGEALLREFFSRAAGR